MTLTPCHLRDMTGLVGLRTLAAVPSRLAYSVASRLGRAFDSICLHHERVYCEGQGPDCFDPDGIHTANKDYSCVLPSLLSCLGCVPLQPQIAGLYVSCAILWLDALP